MSFKSILGIVSIITITTLSTATGASVKEDIAERLSPVGQLCMSGDSCAAAPVVAASSGPRTGDQIYNASCTTCHSAGVAGAPKTGDAAAWAPRIAQGKETLYTHAIKGFNAMPAKGLCMDCSDDEIKASVDYLVEQSQ